MPSQVRKKIAAAWKAYGDAQLLALSEAYNEAKEEQLNKAALTGFREVLPELNDPRVYSDTLLFRIHFAIGELEHFFANYDAAMQEYHSLLGQYHRNTLPDSLFFKPLLYAGLIHYQRGEVDSAAYNFLRADSIQQLYPAPLPESQRLYNTLGVLSYDAGNYRQSRNYFRKALERIPHDDPASLDLESNYLINIAQADLQLGEYDNAITTYRQLIPMGRHLDEIRHNMALAMISKGQAREALSLLKQVSFGPEKQHTLMNSFAATYLILQNRNACREYLDKAVTSYQSGQRNNNLLAETYRIRGDLAMLEDSIPAAIQNYHNAIHYFYPSFNDPKTENVPEQFQGIFLYIDLYKTLVAKAKSWHRLYIRENNLNAAKHALRTYISAYKLLDHVMATYESDEARIFINRSKYESHDEPIRIAYALFQNTGDTVYLEDIYRLDQQNKASVLALNVVRSETLKADPAEQRSLQIRRQITRLSRLATSGTDSTKRDAMEAGVRDLELELSALKDRKQGLDRSWQRVPGIEELRREVLDHRSAVISYHLSDTELTTTLITASVFRVIRKPLPPHFRDDIQLLVDALKDPGQKVPPTLSASLYQLLLDEVKEQGIARLVIIPDDELIYLPFETLRDKQGRLALEQYSMLYQYSTAFMKGRPDQHKAETSISFAPFAGSAADSFPRLPSSGGEVNTGNGLVFTDARATKQAFLSHAGTANIIHLATHARAYDTPGASYLAFRDARGKADLLYENEIYTMDLSQTSMVILSACETGSGSLAKGEGVMSLSRAFTYAGADDVITTLWKADDQTTAYLVKKIIAYQTDGMSNDEAIRRAKLDLLSDEKMHPRTRHPYYWSHLVLVGNIQPERGNRWPWMILLGLGLAGVAGYLYRRKYFTRS